LAGGFSWFVACIKFGEKGDWAFLGDENGKQSPKGEGTKNVRQASEYDSD